MAAGSITTLPALPEDGGSGAFPPGHFKDPKRLYCKNGGFFLRIHPDGRVDGVREKSDPHIKLQLQAEERGVVSIKGVCANRYLAMKEDGRLLASDLFYFGIQVTQLRPLLIGHLHLLELEWHKGTIFVQLCSLTNRSARKTKTNINE